MFPDGAAGYGLLILRLCVAGMLVCHTLPSDTTASAWLEIGGSVVIALLLCIGLLTPLSCGLSCGAEIALVFRRPIPDPVDLVFTFLVTLALFLLGPGGFSIDSSLFGRRLIIRSRQNGTLDR